MEIVPKGITFEKPRSHVVFLEPFLGCVFFSSKRSTEFPMPKKAEYQVIFSKNRTGAHLEVGFSRHKGDEQQKCWMLDLTVEKL